jgi:hypothetical protein
MKTLTWLVMLAMSPSITETATFDSSALGRLPAGWTASAPRWQVMKDPSAPTPPYVLAHIPSAQNPAVSPVALLEKPALQDGEVSVKFKPLSGRPDQCAGLVWRYQDENNYYFVRADVAAKNVVMYKVENGKRIPLAPRGRPAASYPVKHVVTPNDWSILKVTFNGPVFSVYYDHRRIFRVEDGTFSNSGKVGLWARASSAAYFDNFRVVTKK